MNTQQLTKLAGRIRAWLKTSSVVINHSQSLDQSAAIVGLRNWPEVHAFPDQVQRAELDLAAAVRLSRRLQSKYGHVADPRALLIALEHAVGPVIPNLGSGQSRTIEALGSAWRSASASQGHENIHSSEHIATLLAAALGYDSFEEYKLASNETLDFSLTRYWIVDVPKLRSQIEQLGLELDEQEFLSCLKWAIRATGGPTICVFPWDLIDELQPLVNDAVANDGGVGGQMTMTNCAGAYYTRVEIDPIEDIVSLPDDELVIDYSGTVTSDEHLDAPFCGDTVEVTGTVTIKMLGRRLCGAARVEVLSAELDWSWAVAAQEEEEGPTFSQREALAVELGLTADQAAFVEDAEITPTTTSADVPNGYLVDLTNCEPCEVVDELVQRHGSQKIWVLGASFDHMRHDPWA